jgi:hypothetical protein
MVSATTTWDFYSCRMHASLYDKGDEGDSKSRYAAVDTCSRHLGMAALLSAIWLSSRQALAKLVIAMAILAFVQTV